MDPLSITASSIAVFTALKASSSTAFDAIQSLRKAPLELQRLQRGIKSFTTVLEQIDAAVGYSAIEEQRSPLLQSTHNASNIEDLVQRGRAVLALLNELVTDISGNGEGQELGKRQRFKWLRKEGKARRLEYEIKELKGDLNLRMNSLTFRTMRNVFESLQGIRTSLTPLEGDEISLQLAVVTDGRGRVVYRVDEEPLPAQSPPSTSEPLSMSIESNGTTNTVIASDEQDSTSFVPVDLAVVKDTSRAPCPCTCHHRRCFSTPVFTSQILGQLIVATSGSISSEPACNYPSCTDSRRLSITTTYYMPSWLSASAIIFNFTRSPYGNPNYGLIVRNLIFEHSPLLNAITTGSTTNLVTVFQSKLATPNDMEAFGWTSLTWSIHKNQVAILDFLLKAGGNPNLQDGFGISATDFAWIAVQEKQTGPEMYDYLRTHLLLPIEESIVDYELSPMHQFVLGLVQSSPTDNLATVLSKSSHAQVNSSDRFGRTALLWASRLGDFEAVQSLLHSGADANKVDCKGLSPLHMAVRSRCTSTIQILLKFGANPQACNLLNETPLHFACYEENGPRLVEPFLAPEHHCKVEKDVIIGVNNPSKYGRRPLDIAVQWNLPVLVEYLLEHGAVIDGPGSLVWEHRPLGRALLYGLKEVVEVLYRHGCDVYSTDAAGDNLLQFLAAKATLDVLHCLEVLELDTGFANHVNGAGKRIQDMLAGRDEDFKAAIGKFYKT